MEELGIRVGPKPVSKGRKSQAQRVDTVKIWNISLPGEVVEGFDDKDETDSDLEDKPVPLSIEVFYLVFSSKGEGV
jgi:hypothetical protein